MGLMRGELRHAVAIVPADAGTFDSPAFVYVGGDGNVVAIPEGSAVAVTFVGMSAGDILPVLCTRVNSTSTTATNLVAMW